jgi:protoporphyrinogen oxidase
MKTAILGGGLTGLTIGYLLDEKGVDFKIFEKEKDCGGLMRSLKQDGFTFDYGGSHVLFSKNKEALSFLLSLLENNVTRRRRKAKILYKEHYVKYPFENGLSDLSKEDNFECISGFVENLINKQSGKICSPVNLRDWFHYTFGKGITEKYLIPYNSKIWKYPPEKMSLEWSDRIPNPPVEDIIKSSLGIKTEGYVHQLYFYYPLNAGIQAIIDKLHYPLSGQITTSYEVRKIKRERNSWLVSDGTHEELFERIISTIPMTVLIKAMCVPPEVKEAASNLKYNSLISVMVGLNLEKVSDFSWLYIPDPNILPHRVSFPSNYSPNVAPKGKSSILAEVTCSVESEIWKMSDDKLADRVIDDLAFLKLIDKKDVCFSIIRKTEYAYVINDLKYAENLQTVTNFLTKEGIGIVGRFGEFRYLNMDACVRSAKEYLKSDLAEFVRFCRKAI